uniref:Uncharacterized protein n=1 Tax=Physcomitrium patens TaxID=3218 RepID=A0A2K1JCR5_PHYPA|nr:hypothetical protein PHYPA_019604 [Physcomitrium patens]
MAYYSYSPDLMKRLKEEFVSNLEGTTMREIAAMSALFPVGLFLPQFMNRVWQYSAWLSFSVPEPALKYSLRWSELSLLDMIEINFLP